MRVEISIDRLKELLVYDEKTGLFFRKLKYSLKQSGTKTKNGFIQIGLDGKHYLAHRLAWIYFHNQTPPFEIEHINGNKSDNRIENLREFNELNIKHEQIGTEEWKNIFLDVFRYENGELYWKKKVSDKVAIGERAGDEIPHNINHPELKRRRIRIYNKSWQEHRVIFLMFNDYLPNQIDHIDCNPLNNKIENLRAATASQNGSNKKVSKQNSSGYKNVRWDKARKKWRSEIVVNNRPVFIGRFELLDDAVSAACEARDKHFGEFARHE